MYVEVAVVRQHWLTENVFEIFFKSQDRFTFIPGQKISLVKGALSREYTLINTAGSAELSLCVRYLPDGLFSPLLARAKEGDRFGISKASGFFTFQSQKNAAVFVATGTGIAPFLAFARAGIRGDLLVHGATNEGDLLYRSEMERAAAVYIPCLTDSAAGSGAWSGRVTSYLEVGLKEGTYDFYLCGNGNMVRDAVTIIDRRFPGSRVFMESFF